MYERARQLSPTLIVVEDIDTTGGMDRRVADHPLLGEFLQCMDGMVKNSGVITVATTNHSGSIDPAIADRPGRLIGSSRSGCQVRSNASESSSEKSRE